MASWMIVMGTWPPLNSTVGVAPSVTVSLYTSVTSNPVTVAPQARSSLNPRTTPGSDANATPSTFTPLAPPKRLVLRWTYHHTAGLMRDRCGSFASMDDPDAVLDPATTQLFEPRPSKRTDRSCCRPRQSSAARTAAID